MTRFSAHINHKNIHIQLSSYTHEKDESINSDLFCSVEYDTFTYTFAKYSTSMFEYSRSNYFLERWGIILPNSQDSETRKSGWQFRESAIDVAAINRPTAADI